MPLCSFGIFFTLKNQNEIKSCSGKKKGEEVTSAASMKRTNTMMRMEAGIKSSIKVNSGVKNVLTWEERNGIFKKV